MVASVPLCQCWPGVKGLRPAGPMVMPAGSRSPRCLISEGLLTSITWRPLREEWSWKWQGGEQVITREQSCQALFIFMPSKTSATDRRCWPLCHGGMSVAPDGKAAVSKSALARDPQITHLGPWKTYAVILPPGILAESGHSQNNKAHRTWHRSKEKPSILVLACCEPCR